MARISVVGPGAVGLLFGGALQQRADHEVTFCGRSSFDRLRVPNAVPSIDAPARCLSDPGQVDGPADWVVVATKAQDTEGARDWLRALCGSATIVVVAQNGIEQAERGSAVVPDGVVVVPAVTYCAAQRSAPGTVEHFAVQPVKLVVPLGAVGEALQACFAGTFATVELSSDWTAAAWKKLALNFVTAGICALTHRRSDIIRHPGVLPLMAALFDEFLSVATAAGVGITDDYRNETLKMIEGLPDGLAPSMLQDRLASRSTEHDAMYGAVVRAAERTTTAAPLASCIYTLLDASGYTPVV